MEDVRDELHKPQITSKIMEKIQALTRSCEGGDFRCIADVALIPASPHSVDKTHAPKLNVWKVSHRILVFGQCWGNSTENVSRRNSDGELAAFLDANYAGRHMVWCFTDSLRERRSVQRFQNLDFDLGLAHRISCAVKCWLDISPDNVAAFEIRNSEEDKIRFLINCILSHCGFAAGAVESIFSASANTNTVRRYIKYFDAIGHRQDREHSVVLKQLIMTTVPASDAEFLVGVRIVERDREIMQISEGRGTQMYRDENYVIANDMDCEVFGDIQILVFYECGGRSQDVLRLQINSLFYRQGLYRFGLDDVECLCPRERFSHDFSIDLVVFETGKLLARPQYLCKTDFVQGVRILTEGFGRDFNRTVYEELVSRGRNGVAAKLCAFLEYDAGKTEQLVESLEARGCKDMAVDCRLLPTREMTFRIESKEMPDDIIVPAEQNIECRAVYSNGGQIRMLKPIREVSVPETAKTKAKRGVPRKKEAVEKELPSMVARRPLHWVPLLHTEETIFNDLSGINTDFNRREFEEMFCEPLAADRTEPEKAVHRSVIDGGRLFLVSLSLRHLELKSICPDSLPSLLMSPENPLELQDLLNIERVYPSNEELVSLTTAPFELLTEVERAMLGYSQLLEERRLVDVLVFERRLLSEVFLIENVLQSLLGLYNAILDCSALRILLKAILEIGNAVNFQYSAGRRRARGFKLVSLYVFNDYRGKNNASLFSFLFQMMETNGADVYGLLEDLGAVHSLKNEELCRLLERINEFIEMYTEKTQILDLLGDDAREEYVRFFGFACGKLEELGRLYRECSLHASLVKRKFGEDESRSPSEVLKTLSDFLHSMAQNLHRQAE